MRPCALVLFVVVAAPSWAQTKDPIDNVSRPACCNRRPFEHPDTLDGMPKWPGPASSLVHVPSKVEGWSVAADPRAYEVSCDVVASACTTAILRSRPGGAVPQAVARLFHTEAATAWRGRVLRVRAELRAGAISGWAGVWVRADGAERMLQARTMRTSALTGTTSFRWVELSLLVPPEATQVTFGVELHGEGALFIREVQVLKDDAVLVQK